MALRTDRQGKRKAGEMSAMSYFRSSGTAAAWTYAIIAVLVAPLTTCDRPSAPQRAASEAKTSPDTPIATTNSRLPDVIPPAETQAAGGERIDESVEHATIAAESDQLVIIDTAGGRVVVNNDNHDGLWAPGEEWSLQTVWRIGAAEGTPEEEFGRLTSVSLGPNGHAYLLDFMSQQVRVFDGSGRFVRHIGRAGHGPDEFDGPLAMNWDRHDRLWIADGWNRRYAVFDSQGTLIKSVPRQIRAASGFVQTLVFNASNRIIEEASVRTANGAPATGFVQVDTAGQIGDTFPPLPTIRATSDVFTPESQLKLGPALKSLRPFRPRLVHAVAHDGQIWFANSGEYRLFQRTLSGDTVRVISTRHRELSLLPEEERQIDEALAKGRISRSDLDLTLGRQIIQAIYVLDDGHLLVLIEDETGKDGRVLDIFDPEGRFLGSLRSEYPIHSDAISALRGDTLIVVSQDELDVQHVVRYTIIR